MAAQECNERGLVLLASFHTKHEPLRTRGLEDGDLEDNSPEDDNLEDGDSEDDNLEDSPPTTTRLYRVVRITFDTVTH